MISIRRQLTLLLIATLTLITFSAAIQGYRTSMQMSSRLFDNELIGLTQSLRYAAPNDKMRIFNSGENFAVQIWRDDALILRSLNSPTRAISQFNPGFSEQNFAGTRWRIYAKWFADNNEWIFVGQPLKSRFSLAEGMILAAMAPLIFSIPILALLIYLMVTFGLSPLRKLAHQLSARKGNDFSTIELTKTPKELEPVVSTLNTLLVRLNSAFEREQQFAANAAHELRTPLSVLKINLHNLAQNRDISSVTKLQNDTDRMIHVVNQILLLSRTNPEFFSRSMEQVDVYAIAQTVISECYSQIDAKEQHIELLGKAVVIEGNEFALHTLIQNLLANANKYTPAEGNIRMTIKPQPDSCVLMVEDSGSGMEEKEYVNATQRFYRSERHVKQKHEGSGLGLSIVNQIVMLHHGQIRFCQSELGGLKVEICLPVNQEGRDV